MPADSEFPRGWVLEAAGGNAISITVPAIAGVAHVLTGASWTVLETGASGNYYGGIQVVSGVYIAGGPVAFFCPSGEYTAGQGSWSGKIMSAVGAALTVTLTPGASNSYLEIQGYDV